jgi:hypothetical protein
MATMYRRFFPGCTTVQAEEFAAALPEQELSMAALQGHLLEHKEDAADATHTVPQLLLAAAPQQLVQVGVWEHLRRLGLENYASVFEQVVLIVHYTPYYTILIIVCSNSMGTRPRHSWTA